MTDIVLCVVPGLSVNEIILAPSKLKGYLNDANISSKILDFNNSFYRKFRNEDIYQRVWNWLIDIADNGDAEAREAYNKFNIDCVDKILSFSPTVVGINFFSYLSQKSGELLAVEIKKRNSNIKIVIGGPGISDSGFNTESKGINSLIERGIFDECIRGPGEEALVKYMRNQEFTRVKPLEISSVSKEILNSQLYPDFDDYDFSLYDHRMLPILGSRGCVRKCSFCDVHTTSKFQNRKAKNIFDEIIHNAEKYNCYDIAFMDSLNNGNLKEFTQLLRLFAEYNQTSKNTIKWTSQYIIRSEKVLSEEYWQLMSQSAYSVSIGLETGSDTVRKHMNKDFTNVDVEYTLEKCKKYNIKAILMMISGYPSETLENFQETLDFFTRNVKYKDIVDHVTVGNGLSIIANSPLGLNSASLNIMVDEKYIDNWIALDNPDLTLSERFRRLDVFVKHLESLGYNVMHNGLELERIKAEEELYNKRNKIKKMIKLKYTQQ